MYQGRYIFLISGAGCSGKDTLAKILAEVIGKRYKFSTSFGAARSFWDSMKQGKQIHRGFFPHSWSDFDQFYKDRVCFRKTWADYIDELNQHDPAGLYRYCLEQGNDFLIGIRKLHELYAVEAEGLVDLRIWIDCPGNRVDETQEYGSERCDFTIVNNKLEGIEGLRRKVLNLVRFIQLPPVGLITRDSHESGIKAYKDRLAFETEQERLANAFRNFNYSTKQSCQARRRPTSGDVSNNSG